MMQCTRPGGTCDTPVTCGTHQRCVGAPKPGTALQSTIDAMDPRRQMRALLAMHGLNTGHLSDDQFDACLGQVRDWLAAGMLEELPSTQLRASTGAQGTLLDYAIGVLEQAQDEPSARQLRYAAAYVRKHLETFRRELADWSAAARSRRQQAGPVD